MLAIIAPFLGLAIEAGYRLPPSRRARRLATLGGECAAAFVLCFVALHWRGMLRCMPLCSP